MSKRNLKKYLESLSKDQIAEQFIDLYDKFSDVKTYYDFVFNPKEDKLIQEALSKISNEYFPLKAKRAKLRRSVAQKYIKHFIMLGVDPFKIADVMFFNLETAQKYSGRREIRSVTFYKSMLSSFAQAVNFLVINGIASEYEERIRYVSAEASRQGWPNVDGFLRIIDDRRS